MTLIRNEYPRPQFRREYWQSLNGEWEFEFDDKKEGQKRGLQNGNIPLNTKINVPFSYQYEASGIGDTTQHDLVWYRRKFVISKENKNKNALLCFNAVDYKADVWVNSYHVITHEGGFSPFSVDITDYLKNDENTIVVCCYDSLDDSIPRGKQSWTGESFGCFYIPNTGIWQSVWIDFFETDFISSYSLFPDYDNNGFYGEINTFYGKADELEIVASYDNKQIKKQIISLKENVNNYYVKLTKQLQEDYSWSPDNPKLIYVKFTLLKNTRALDNANTRFAMRKISINDTGKICLNNRPLFQRLVLDQGYWEESGLTPPTHEALKKDIELAKAMGFNGARKHQKFEDPYFYYYAEELGFLTWCEMPSAYRFCSKEVFAITKEWQEILLIARNFTSNICYVPLNESWGTREILNDFNQQNFAKSLYYLTKAIDNEKLISTNDGFENIEPMDILSIHDYDIKTSEEFLVKYRKGEYDGLYPQGFALFSEGNKYKGQPVLFTEFGGIALKMEQKNGAWGYNEGASNKEEYIDRLNELINGIIKTEFQGYCYTQLTDVQQEINGLLYENRKSKVDLNLLNGIFTKKPY